MHPPNGASSNVEGGLFNASNYFKMSTKCSGAFMSRESITMLSAALPELK